MIDLCKDTNRETAKCPDKPKESIMISFDRSLGL